MGQRSVRDAVLSICDLAVQTAMAIGFLLALIFYPVHALVRGLSSALVVAGIRAEMEGYERDVKRMGVDAARAFHDGRRYPKLHWP
jgi:hypothetical protein